jgi:hypothetical protein
MGEQQRQRPWATSLSVHYVQRMTVDRDAQLEQRVEPALKRLRVKVTPVIEKDAQPVPGHPSLPTRAEVRRQPGKDQLLP